MSTFDQHLGGNLPTPNINVLEGPFQQYRGALVTNAHFITASHAQWAFPDEWDRKEFIGPLSPLTVNVQQVADAWDAIRCKSPNEAAFARVGDTPIFVVTNAKMRAFWEARPTEWHGMWRDDIYT